MLRPPRRPAHGVRAFAGTFAKPVSTRALVEVGLIVPIPSGPGTYELSRFGRVVWSLRPDGIT